MNKLDNTIRTSLDDMYEMLEEQNIKATNSPFGSYHGAINEQEDGLIEICLPVNGSVKGKGDVDIKQSGGGNAASVTMLGAT